MGDGEGWGTKVTGVVGCLKIGVAVWCNPNPWYCFYSTSLAAMEYYCKEVGAAVFHVLFIIVR